jgi:hypothetical protein
MSFAGEGSLEYNPALEDYLSLYYALLPSLPANSGYF